MDKLREEGTNPYTMLIEIKRKRRNDNSEKKSKGSPPKFSRVLARKHESE